MGLTVNVQKEYSEVDDSGYPIVDPGYVYAISPSQVHPQKQEIPLL